jgi:hypothetical protein
MDAGIGNSQTSSGSVGGPDISQHLSAAEVGIEKFEVVLGYLSDVDRTGTPLFVFGYVEEVVAEILF